MLQRVADCGVHAAAGAFVYRAQGIPVRRVQLVLEAGDQEVKHWRRKWEKAGIEPAWIEEGLCYHEALALGDSSLRVLDATEPIIWNGIGDGVLAIRVEDPDSHEFLWGTRTIRSNVWEAISEHAAGSVRTSAET